jgi:hypothetical protein
MAGAERSRAAGRQLAAVIVIRKTIDVARAADALYAYLVQPAHIAEYVGPIRRITSADAGPIGVGTQLAVEVHFLGIRFTQRAECTVHQPPDRFECRSVGGRFNFSAGFTLEPAARGSRLNGWGEASAPSLFRFAEPAVGYFMERQVERDLARLKTVLESGQD